MKPFDNLIELLDTYMNVVVPKAAGAMQRRDMKMTFLAGASAMFEVMTAINTDNEDEAVKLMDDLRKRTMAAAIAVKTE